MPAQSFGITGPAYASMNRSVPTGAGGGGGGGAFFGDGPKTDFISRNNWFDDGQSTDPMFIASYA